MMKVFTVLVCVVLSLAACNAATLRGAPDVVLASTAYMVKSADQQIEATEKDLQDKKEAFKLRVIEEKKVVEKTKKVEEIALDCIKVATTKRNDATKQVADFTAKLIPAKKIDFARASLEAAEDAEKKAQVEFKHEEGIFHHDMHHLESVKNESTRIIALLNGHYSNKQNRQNGGGLVKPVAELHSSDTLDDLIPSKIRGHVNVGKKVEVKKELEKEAQKKNTAPAATKTGAKFVGVPSVERQNVVALLQMAQHNGLGEYTHLIRHLNKKFSDDQKKKSTSKAPYQHPGKNAPKYYSRTASTDEEQPTHKHLDVNTKAENERVSSESLVKNADKNPKATSVEKEANSGKLKLTALGKKINVGKDVGGHVVAAMAKLHGFIADHSQNRETAFELATKDIRKNLAHARSENKRLTALIADFVKTNLEIRKNINDFKALVTQNQMQIDQCKLDQERAKLGESDANTKIGHMLSDLAKLTKSYKNIVGNFKNEKSTAQYVTKMMKKKIVQLRNFLETAKKARDAKKKVVAEKFVDPELPKYKGLPDALQCDPNATPDKWCETPEMMVRCGVTKESCDTFHFQTLAMPPHKVPEKTQGDATSWATTQYKDHKKGQPSVDARSEAEQKRDMTADDDK
jgi:hypothetical protein